MDSKVKHLLKWLAISLEKANDDATRHKINNEHGKSLMSFGEGNAFSQTMMKVNEIFKD